MDLNPHQVTSFSLDISPFPNKAEELIEHIAQLSSQAIEEGSAIICFPELLWFSVFSRNTVDEMKEFSSSFWNNHLPYLQSKLPSQAKNCFLLLGTAPGLSDEGELFNRAVILNQGRIETQDKIYLTPWETYFSEGKQLKIFQFNDLKVAINICFDVEQPELAARLKKESIDLLLVPSATETPLGVERITRSASCRSIELGCTTVTSHLIGTSLCEMIDQNYGRIGLFHPAQSLFSNSAREALTEITSQSTQKLSFQVPAQALKEQRKLEDETNPVLAKGSIDIDLLKL